jgi:M6 family metalloprotease-like protein
MKKSKTFRPIHLFVTLASCLGVVAAAPFPPEGRPITWNKPDGSSVKLRVFGDEYYARTETEDGYTVVYDETDNSYHYAKVAADGSALVASDSLVTDAVPAGLAKHIDLSKGKIRQISGANHEKFDGEQQKQWDARVKAYHALHNDIYDQPGSKAKLAEAQVLAAPVTGSKVGLTILVQFPKDTTDAQDLNHTVKFPTDQAKIQRFCNGVGYTEDGNTGSVRDYYKDQSNGKLDYTQSVTNIVTVAHPRNYYNYSDYPTNKIVRPNAGEAGTMLLSDALSVLVAQKFDFSKLTLDNNRRALATNIFFAGEDSGVFARGLWPHQSTISDVNVSVGGAAINISRYEITNAADASPVIGTFCHENGHLLMGYPDIYANEGEGVGEHCLMGSGNYLNNGKTPSPINMYFKEIVGWAKITDFTPDTSRAVSVLTTGNVGYRIRKPGTPTESFVVENRGNGDKWAQYSDDKGIIIWHIDETIDGNYFSQPIAHYGIAVMQADGRRDLENGVNRGDRTDYFDIAGYPLFSNTTTPNANWFDGTSSFVTVKMLSAPDASTNVQFGTLPSNTIAVLSPNGGESIYPGSSFPITWDANIIGNVKIELFKNGEFRALISEDTPNDGRFDWAIGSTVGVGTGYSIRISSLTNDVPASDESNATFALSDTHFPAGGVIPNGWFKPAGAQTMWKVTGQEKDAFEGSKSLVSAPSTGDGKVSGIAYRTTFKAGTVSFYIKISSEKDYDVARFYIDGKPQIFKNGGSRSSISGATGWIYASYALTAGKHTLKWTYEKDDSYGELRDSAWIDGVTLPETTQEIAVADPKGANLTSGVSSVGFPTTFTDSTSKPQTFTISNRGKSYLYGLSVSVSGSKDFKASALSKNSLAPGKSMTFNVTFSPSTIGSRSGQLVIKSNDANESKFTVGLFGEGTGFPVIGVNLSNGTALQDNGKVVSFGSSGVGSAGSTKTFTVVNKGNGDLKNLKISSSGKDMSSFKVSAPGTKSLAPGEKTTFTVTFKPNTTKALVADIKVISNDKKSPFDINVTGTGTAKKSAGPLAASDLVAAVLGGNSASATSYSVSSVEVIDGSKYLALTVAKPFEGRIEVSSNLLDWYSGANSTTVVTDNATTLKVRDNTPVTPDVKRYIRIK